MRTYRTEHQEQAHLILWAQMMKRDLPGIHMLFAIPNGGHRNLLVAKKMKEEGVRPGVPDLCLPVPAHGYHGLWIELKTETSRPVRGGRGGLSDVQQEWLDRLNAYGYRAVVCYGAEEAKNEITNYLKR
jgi:hypothetical protein